MAFFTACFRPLMGIILFNKWAKDGEEYGESEKCFRPLMGIILFNKMLMELLAKNGLLEVSVP